MELEEQYRKKKINIQTQRGGGGREYDKNWVLTNLNSVLGI